MYTQDSLEACSPEFIVILPSQQTPFALAIQIFLWFLYTSAWVPFKVTVFCHRLVNIQPTGKSSLDHQ